jgi:hypothetical protein
MLRAPWTGLPRRQDAAQNKHSSHGPAHSPLVSLNYSRPPHHEGWNYVQQSQTRWNLLDGYTTCTLASVAGMTKIKLAGNQYCNFWAACQWLDGFPLLRVRSGGARLANGGHSSGASGA